MKVKEWENRERGKAPILLLLAILVLSSVFYASTGSRTIYIKSTKVAIQTVFQFALSEVEPEVINKEELHILLLGHTGPGHIAPHLTDTIISISWNKKSEKVLVVSLPRDLLVQIPGSRYQTKINALYQIGIQEGEDANIILAKASDITGFPYDYFVTVDVNAFEQFVDALGGVNVEVLEDIEDMRFPTPSGGYEVFSLEKGWRYLDGATTTKYVRTRHTARGDFDRVKRQQQVIEALRKKVSQLNPLIDFPKLLKMYSALYGHINTNMTVEEGKGVWALSKDLSRENISFLSLEKIGDTPLLVSGTTILGGKTASILKPAEGVEQYNIIRKTLEELLQK